MLEAMLSPVLNVGAHWPDGAKRHFRIEAPRGICSKRQVTRIADIIGNHDSGKAVFHGKCRPWLKD